MIIIQEAGDIHSWESDPGMTGGGERKKKENKVLRPRRGGIRSPPGCSLSTKNFPEGKPAAMVASRPDSATLDKALDFLNCKMQALSM